MGTRKLGMRLCYLLKIVTLAVPSERFLREIQNCLVISDIALEKRSSLSFVSCGGDGFAAG